MKILPSTNATRVYNSNNINVKPSVRPVFDTCSFTGAAGILKPKTVEALQNISYAYDDIMAQLLRKSDAGLENIEKNFQDFSFKKGLVFHNCGDEGVSIAVRKPEGKMFGGLMRVMVRQGNSFFKERNVLESFMIKDCDKLVRDFDRTHLNNFAKSEGFFSPQQLSEAGAEEKLLKITDDLDFAMLKFRQYLAKNKDVDLRIPDFVISDGSAKTLGNIEKLDKTVTEKLSNLPKKVALFAKSSFHDYKLSSGQATNMFTNIGPDNLKMAISSLKNSEHGTLKRIMVYDYTDKVHAGFLMTSDGKFISNFNPEYFGVVPPKLAFLNENEAKTVMPEFEEYLRLFEAKLQKFDSHIDTLNIRRELRLKEIEERKTKYAADKKLQAARRAEKEAQKQEKIEKQDKKPAGITKSPKPPKPPVVKKSVPFVRQKAYGELVKTSLKELKTSFLAVDDNLDGVHAKMDEILKKFEEYIAAHK